MDYTISENSTFPIVKIMLDESESVQIESGSMIYHDDQVELAGKMNSNRKHGLSGLVSAIGRGMTSGESLFMTSATGKAANSELGIAPANPGKILALQVSEQQKWRINTGAFLAADEAVNYNMVRQSVGRAFFGGTGGLFVMESGGTGTMLVSAYGDILPLELDGTRDFVVDNYHVVAWDQQLSYEITPASGLLGFTTGEGLVNRFHGKGTIYLQTRNLESLANIVEPFLPSSQSSD